MLEIKNTQLNKLSSIKEDELIDKLIDNVYNNIKEARIVSRESLREELKFQCKKAHFYGIHTDKNIGIFLFSAFVLGKDFDTNFPIFRFLKDSDLDENTKGISLESFTKLIINTLTAK